MHLHAHVAAKAFFSIWMKCPACVTDLPAVHSVRSLHSFGFIWLHLPSGFISVSRHFRHLSLWLCLIFQDHQHCLAPSALCLCLGLHFHRPRLWQLFSKCQQPKLHYGSLLHQLCHRLSSWCALGPYLATPLVTCTCLLPFNCSTSSSLPPQWHLWQTCAETISTNY